MSTTGSPRLHRAPGRAGDELRLMAKVALMYHERGVRQAEIARELHLSQSKVSRLLTRAAEVGIVRTTVTVPAGVHTDLESRLEQRYGLSEAIVVDVSDDEHEVAAALGSALASYLESALTGPEVVGISSWSATLLAGAEAMRRSSGAAAERIVQIVGGVGEARVQVLASRLIGLLAETTGAEPVFMPAPGTLGSAASRRVLMEDPAVAAVMDSWSQITTALVGIGSLQPSDLLRQSGNAVAEGDLQALRAVGAVGDICLRFFSEDGQVVRSDLDERVIGIDPDRFRGIARRIGVAGGARKHDAIAGALHGGWLTVLITDVGEAERLLADPAD